MPLIRTIADALPGRPSFAMTLLSAVLLAAAFPGYEFSILAWIAIVPLLAALEMETGSRTASFLLGWIFGTVFFAVTCWWLTFAPITYAGFPVVPTYLLLLTASAAAGIFPAFFALVYGAARDRLGRIAILLSPFIWAAFEFLRYWITGNNWNALAYSQAFEPMVIQNASIGGIYLTGFTVFLSNALVFFAIVFLRSRRDAGEAFRPVEALAAGSFTLASVLFAVTPLLFPGASSTKEIAAQVIAVQPNVPMNGLDFDKWRKLRARQTELAEDGLRRRAPDVPALVVLPESPMNYQYGADPEFREFIGDFARRNSAAVLFNSAEPDPARERGFFNSAVMVNASGEKSAQYDKIYLLPFGEFVPLPEFAQDLIPPMVGRFSRGEEYDLLDVGGAKAGVMICFESHFPSLSAEYARRGAGFLIEMTNDGYLGDTPVLRQHLANAVFRAVETDLPLMRVTNVGVTAMIDGHGTIYDEQKPYTETVRVWGVLPSGAGATFYSRTGDWFALLCCLVAAGAVVLSLKQKPE